MLRSGEVIFLREEHTSLVTQHQMVSQSAKHLAAQKKPDTKLYAVYFINMSFQTGKINLQRTA